MNETLVTIGITIGVFALFIIAVELIMLGKHK